MRDAGRPGHNVPVTSYRVMTVCTGNICRSPMAEVVLRERLEQAGLDGLVEVDSTGVSDEERGSPIDPRARTTLVAHGYPVPAHRARRATRDELADRDLVLAMTAGHVRALRRIGGDATDIRMLRSFDPQAPTGAADHLLDVDDPWYGPQEAFERTLAEIEAAVDGVVAHIRAELDG
jgi:protein-tyrosine phosphatase